MFINLLPKNNGMQSVKLFLMRFLYGKFSYYYQNSFLLNNYQKSNRQKFLQSCSKINGLGHIRSAFELKRENVVIQTKIPIKFHKIDTNEIFWSFVRKNRNFVGYDIEKYETHYWRRLAYREKIFNTGVKTIYHFLDDKFFFGEFFFADARDLDISLIKTILCDKFDLTNNSLNEKFKIQGNDAFIFFEFTGINLSIKYIFTNDQNINSILNQLVYNQNSTNPKNLGLSLAEIL